MNNIFLLIWLLSNPALARPGELAPPAWQMPAERAPRTRLEHEREILTGPRGGRYYLQPSGRKRYVGRDQ